MKDALTHAVNHTLTVGAMSALMPSFGAIAIVAAGGAAGCVARYLLGALVAGALPRVAGHFPVATLCANVIGCTLAGALIAWLGPSAATDHPARLTLLVGFLGGLTTFSAFAVESLELLDRAPALGLASIGLNVCVSLAGAWAGMMLVKMAIA